jgi:phosphoserine phosphatase RsbU/P
MKLLELNPDIQPVVVSAYGDMKNIRTAMNCGAFDFLTKPIDFDDFRITVAKALQQLRMVKESSENRERLAAIQRELSIACTIQQSILPRADPQFVGPAPVDVAATMLPARSVGGDFYDYFLVDPERLGLVIGDVSGKGVPAAIFMAVGATVLETVAMRGGAPGECLTQVNVHLCQQNRAEMFITLFYGILNVRTGELQFAAAGHNPPYRITPERAPTVLTAEAGGLPLGLFEAESYGTRSLVLLPGETLVLYTDGVTEAMNVGGQQFTSARLMAFLQRSNIPSAVDLVNGVVAAVGEFAAGREQWDDLTVLAVRYLGKR